LNPRDISAEAARRPSAPGSRAREERVHETPMNRAFFAVVVLALSANGCDAFEDPVEAAPCNDIPEGGCPAPADSDGGVIENCKADPTCSALYACQPTGGWSLLVECPAR